MRTKALRAVAVTLGLGACAIAQAQDGYSTPSKWNNFRTISDGATAIQEVTPAAELPPPIPEPLHSSTSIPSITGSPAVTEVAPSTGSAVIPDAYSQAMSAPWEGPSACSTGNCGPGMAVRPALSPWFGSGNVLFMTLERGRGNLIARDGPRNYYAGVVDPSSTVGFETQIGRYFGCGEWGLGVNYFHWNPSTERRIYNGLGPGLRPVSPLAGVVSLPGAIDVYGLIDGAATDLRMSRDMMFQGIEANLYGFGLMGARRAAYAGCNTGGMFGGKPGCGYGGAAGPLVRPTNGRVRITTSHGFRWFQVKDEFEVAYNVDGFGGYQPTDLYEQKDVENNLYGYQFGGMLNYCLSNRWNMNVGGKFGLYGNNHEVRYRMFDSTGSAYITAIGAGAGDLNTVTSETSLATLGEFDLGLGFRISNAWTVRGGYRLMSICGVVDATDLPTDYTSVASASSFDADDCLILHGGYVGLTYNW